MTQGRSRREALTMIEDWFVTLIDREGFSVQVHEVGKRDVEIGSSDAGAMISLLLRRQRHRSGLTLAQAAKRLKARSRNAYARYEQGISVPTIEKLDELLRAVAPDHELVVRQRTAA
jgi:hypothetical protein